ncbi:UNVERIFIED_CONTAM: hypothetical protein Sradi_0974000 [Sesamum radiatum]|uniref:Reverse transcriptase zinc-binding domain-containing protein n=1 Tax=Sesamum radiatum TaxID=300843 RepID=A0AAW2V4T8_SESRA
MLPNKVKVFAWRICLNALPTSVNLTKRLKEPLGGCPFCHIEEEDTMHILLHCPFARQVWSLSPFSIVLYSFLVPDVCNWLQLVSSKIDAREFGLFLCLCWTVWWCRNRKLMEGVCFDPHYVVSFVSHYLHSFLIQSNCSDSRLGPSISPGWQAPAVGVIKLNFDGAILSGGRVLGVGVAARDDTGQCVA